MVQKIIISIQNKEKIINLGKIYKLNRNEFWKAVKIHKKKKTKNNNLTEKTGLADFEKFYERLFSHEGLHETEDHINIRNNVNDYYINNNYTKFNIEISQALLESCFKKLKNNKAVGHDLI